MRAVPCTRNVYHLQFRLTYIGTSRLTSYCTYLCNYLNIGFVSVIHIRVLEFIKECFLPGTITVETNLLANMCQDLIADNC